ncbi:MAG: lipid A-modifier LpxR family protein [Oceanicaulis sp.]
MTARTMQHTIAPSAFLGRASLGALAAAVCMAAPAPAQGDDRAPSAETRSIILGPLQDEFTGDAPRQPGARLAAAPLPGALRYTPRPAYEAEPASPRPAAARFAGAALVARSDTVTRDRLAAFTGEETTLAFSPSGGRVSLSLFDGGTPDAAFLGFDPEYASAAGRALYGERDRARRMAVRYETSFDATSADGLDYGLAPRAGVSLGGDGGAAVETGATVRLGQYIDTDFDRPAWWFFAGADRQAVMYDPGQGFDMRDAVAMDQYAIVGDAQAGVAMRMGGADVSFAYVRRETEYAMPNQSWETSEGFAAFSLTWRR